MTEHPAVAFLEDVHTRVEAMARSIPSVLLRIENERAILTEHGPQDDGSGLGILHCSTCAEAGEGDWSLYRVSYPCKTVLALAKGWGWEDPSSRPRT